MNSYNAFQEVINLYRDGVRDNISDFLKSASSELTDLSKVTNNLKDPSTKNLLEELSEKHPSIGKYLPHFALFEDGRAFMIKVADFWEKDYKGDVDSELELIWSKENVLEGLSRIALRFASEAYGEYYFGRFMEILEDFRLKTLEGIVEGAVEVLECGASKSGNAENIERVKKAIDILMSVDIYRELSRMNLNRNASKYIFKLATYGDIKSVKDALSIIRSYTSRNLLRKLFEAVHPAYRWEAKYFYSSMAEEIGKMFFEIMEKIGDIDLIDRAVNVLRDKEVRSTIMRFRYNQEIAGSLVYLAVLGEKETFHEIVEVIRNMQKRKAVHFLEGLKRLLYDMPVKWGKKVYSVKWMLNNGVYSIFLSSERCSKCIEYVVPFVVYRNYGFLVSVMKDLWNMWGAYCYDAANHIYSVAEEWLKNGEYYYSVKEGIEYLTKLYAIYAEKGSDYLFDTIKDIALRVGSEGIEKVYRAIKTAHSLGMSGVDLEELLVKMAENPELAGKVVRDLRGRFYELVK